MSRISGTAAAETSAADWLEVVQPHLAACLAGASALARLRILAGTLPMGGAVVLETRPPSEAGQSGPVDISLQVTTPELAVALASLPATPLAGASLSGASESAPWRQFLRAWARRPAWRLRAPALWLEYDLEAPADLPVMPAQAGAPADLPVQPTPQETLAGRQAVPVAAGEIAAAPEVPEPVLCARLAASAEARWVEGSLLPAMRGRPLAPEQRRLFRRCWAEIPPPGVPLYVFSMQPRGAGAVRIEIGGDGLRGVADLAAFLERVGAPAAAVRVAALQPLLAEADRLHLSCDLDELDGAIAPRFGVELSFPRQPRREPRWARLFERLVAAGLCTPGARDGALAWPGQDSLWTAGARWPAGQGPARRCLRCLSHLKLVCDGRRPTAAKIYLLYAVA